MKITFQNDDGRISGISIPQRPSYQKLWDEVLVPGLMSLGYTPKDWEPEAAPKFTYHQTPGTDLVYRLSRDSTDIYARYLNDENDTWDRLPTTNLAAVLGKPQLPGDPFEVAAAQPDGIRYFADAAEADDALWRLHPSGHVETRHNRLHEWVDSGFVMRDLLDPTEFKEVPAP